MKRYCTSLLATLFFVWITNSSFAQNESSVHGFEFLGTYTGHGYGGSVGYVSYLSDLWYLRVDGIYITEKDKQLNHKIMGGDIIVGRTIKYYRSIEMYMSVIGGLTASQESGNFDGQEEDYKLLKYGVLAGIEFEKYFGQRISLAINANQRYLPDPQDRWGSLRWNAQVGIRFHLASVGKEE